MTNNVKRVSRREFKRRVAETNANSTPGGLSEELEQLLVQYRPVDVDESLWATVAPLVHQTMRATRFASSESFKKHMGIVAHYVLWQNDRYGPMTFPDVFNQGDIDGYFLTGINGTDKTRNSYRSRLLSVCARVNPSAVVAPVPHGPTYRKVRPGFSDHDMKAIRLAVTRERSLTLRRQLCAAVGLCAGAGLSATDIKELTTDRVIDHGEAGIEVRVSGDAARIVWVRRDYESLVRLGVEGLDESALVIGTKATRRNVVGNLVDRADLFDCPHFDASRLRSTWLVWLVSQPIPLRVVMYATGLKTARTLVDLIAYLDNDDAYDGYQPLLRDGSDQ